MAPADDSYQRRLDLFQQLDQLPPAELNRLMFALGVPRNLVPPDTAKPGDRVSALLQWAESPLGKGLDPVEHALTDLLANPGDPLAPAAGGSGVKVGGNVTGSSVIAGNGNQVTVNVYDSPKPTPLKWLQKAAAGICLLIGIPITLLVLVEFVNPSATDDDKGGALAALGILGLPPTALGGWFIYSLNRQHKKTLEKQELARYQMFLKFLEANQGTVNPLVFATQANLSLEDAKEYLDEKAVQLNGLYEATGDGGAVYRFPL